MPGQYIAVSLAGIQNRILYPAGTDITAGSGTILLVDDEKVILAVNLPMLEKLEYTVFTAEGGRQAIELFDANHDRIAMVILDMIMPDLDGVAVFGHLYRQNSPDLSGPAAFQAGSSVPATVPWNNCAPKSSCATTFTTGCAPM